ncbi:MAG TPA: NUDIX domain-containing protein [Candidatus Paceibacterota bacterium]|nr:NUDIX domain-containing protein [Candidatus Paceibacterota bacterium]
MEKPQPQVVVGVVIYKNGEILFGKRVRGDGKQEYAGPGGRLQFGESLEECAIRKAREEAGIEIQNPKVVAFQNVLSWEGSHYLDIGVIAEWKSGEPIVTQYSSCEKWSWYSQKSLPSPLIVGDQHCIDAQKTNQIYFGTVR